MRKKILSILLSAAMLVTLLAAGCSSQTTTTTAVAATTTAAAGDTTAAAATDATTAAETTMSFAGEELSILVSQDWMGSYYDGIIARFEKEYDVTVELQTTPADQYDDLLQSKLTSGTVTDIFWIQSNPF